MKLKAVMIFRNCLIFIARHHIPWPFIWQDHNEEQTTKEGF